MKKYRNVLVWPIMGVALILFWISLRSKTDQMEYAIYALLAWGLAYLLNKQLREDPKD